MKQGVGALMAVVALTLGTTRKKLEFLVISKKNRYFYEVYLTLYS